VGAIGPSNGGRCRSRRREYTRQPSVPAASDRLVPKRSATRLEAWQRPQPDAGNFGGEVSLSPIPRHATAKSRLVMQSSRQLGYELMPFWLWTSPPPAGANVFPCARPPPP